MAERIGAIPLLGLAAGSDRTSLRRVSRSEDDGSDGERTSKNRVTQAKNNLYDDKKRTSQRLSEEDKSEQVELSHPVRDFTAPDNMCNAVLVVDGTELHVHKEVLGQWSLVMMQMFTSSFIEGQCSRVELIGKSLEDVSLLLNCIYPPNQQVTAENYLQILPLADEYDITLLKHRCEEVVLSLPAGLDLILLSLQYNLSESCVDKMIEKCSRLPMNEIDHKTAGEITEHIPDNIFTRLYRLKIEHISFDRAEINRARKTRQVIKSKILNWGTQRNTYPCEQHLTFKKTCVNCLTEFRNFALTNLKQID